MRDSAKEIAIVIYKIVQTIGKTNLGGVIVGLIQVYHADLVAFIVVEFGIYMTKTIIRKESK